MHSMRKGKTTYTYQDIRLGFSALQHTQANTASAIALITNSIASLPLKHYYPNQKTKTLKLQFGTFYTLQKLTKELLTIGKTYITFDEHTKKITHVDIDTDFDYQSVWRIDDMMHSQRQQALEPINEEIRQAQKYRSQLWKRAGRIGGWLSLPEGYEMDNETRTRFSKAWKEFRSSGSRAGETPVLENGMQWHNSQLSAREEQWAEIAEFNKISICNLFNIPPSMLSNNAIDKQTLTYFYTDTLAPWMRSIQEVMSDIVETFYGEGHYVRFNIDAKLAGSFEEQASVLSTSTGAPWLKVNEARAIRDLPPVEGGDELIVPLNVTKGGQASPQNGSALPVAVENAKQLLQTTQDKE